MKNRGKVTDKEKRLLFLIRFSDKGYNIISRIHTVNPLETIRLVIFLIESRV